jgi:hypothetical protein
MCTGQMEAKTGQNKREEKSTREPEAAKYFTFPAKSLRRISQKAYSFLPLFRNPPPPLSYAEVWTDICGKFTADMSPFLTPFSEV